MAEFTLVADLMDRVVKEDFGRYLDRFRGIEENGNELTFGPLDAIESDLWESVSDRLFLLAPDGALVDNSDALIGSISRDIKALLESAPSNREIDGYPIQRDMPKAIRAKTKLWRTDDWRLPPAEVAGFEVLSHEKRCAAENAYIQDYKKSPARFVNSDLEKWEDYHQTLSLFWSRQTYQVDLTVFDWLNDYCSTLRPEQVALPGNFADHLLGEVAALAEKWRPLVGCSFVVEDRFAKHGWARKWKEVSGQPVQTGGRPALLGRIHRTYFKRFPQTHLDPTENQEVTLTWDHVHRIVEDEIGVSFDRRTLERAITQDARYRTAKGLPTKPI